MQRIPIHKIFVVLAFIYGLTFVLITPPFQTPDETSHFFRAYQISCAQFRAVKENDRTGGYVPQSIDSFANFYKKYSLNPYCKMNFEYLKKTFTIPLRSDKIVFKDFCYTALYSPISYLPQSVVLFCLRVFNVRPAFLLYLSRLSALIFWIILIYFSIKIIPVQKYLLAFLAFLPMSLLVNSSISADVVTNGLSFFLIAYTLRIALGNKKFSRKDLIIISIVVVLLGFAKVLYATLALLFFVIPVAKIGSLKKYLLIGSLILFLGFGSTFIWAKCIHGIYTPYKNYNVQIRDEINLADKADVSKQIEFISEHKKHCIKIFVRSFFQEFNGLTSSYIGLLGWGDTVLPDWFIIINYIFIFLLAISTNYEKAMFTFTQRIILVFIFILITWLIMLSQYLSWDDVASEKVYPLQGRYFIPIIPLIFIVLYNNWFHFPRKYLKATLVIMILFSLTYAVSKNFSRFYYNYNLKKKWETTSTCEIQNNNNESYLVNGSDTIVKLCSIIPTIEKAHSGQYSVKLTGNNQFGFTHIIYNARKGDKILVSAWRFGKSGNIAFSEFKKDGAFHHSIKTYEKERTGWIRLESEFFVPYDMLNTEMRVFIWHLDTDSAYFDDFKINYYQKVK
jgi:uncharacterized membrane protein